MTPFARVLIPTTEVARVSPWPALAPVLCAVHCLAAPGLTLIAPALVELPALEWGLYASSTVAVVTVLPRGYRRHGRARYTGQALAGLIAWLAILVGDVPGDWPEETLVAGASITVALALIRNLHRLRRLAREDRSAECCTTCGDAPCHLTS